MSLLPGACTAGEKGSLCLSLATVLLSGLLSAQAPAPAVQSADGAATSSTKTTAVQPPRQPTTRERNRAAAQFLQATKDFNALRYEEAVQHYKEAIRLDPSRSDYPLALVVARNHAVTALVQKAAKAGALGDLVSAREALAHARELDPLSQQVATHMNDLLGRATAASLQDQDRSSSHLGETPVLTHSQTLQSFHLRANAHEVIQRVFKAWNIDVTFDYSVPNTILHFDLDDGSYQEVVSALRLATKTYFVVLDPHRVVAVRDTKENRARIERQNLETIYLAGVTKEDLAEITKIAKEAFGIQGANYDDSQHALTLHAGTDNLNAFNFMLRDLLSGRSQMMLDVRAIQLAHTKERTNGAQATQSLVAYNVYTEAESVISANSSIVNQIVSSGLASATDYTSILLILAAYGYVDSSYYANGLATFGGGMTKEAISPGSNSIALALNSSTTKALDHVQLRLGDGEDGKIRLGERYPIQTSSYSSLSSSSTSSALAGLLSSGTSSNLSSLLASYSSASTIPMVEYQDIGLTLKATPKIMRSGDVALTVDLKLDALSGSTVNSVPVLNSRTYSSVVTLREGESVVVAQELDKSQTKSLSGTPGLSEIPGLSQLVADNDKDVTTSTLLIVMTPHVLRSTQQAGHTPMMRVEPAAGTTGR